MPTRDRDTARQEIFEPNDAGQRLLELWARVDALAALVRVACTTATGIDQNPPPQHVMVVLGETLGLAEEARASVASSQEIAASLSDTLAQIAAWLDQWLDMSGVTTIDGRPVAELRAKLGAIIAPAMRQT